MSIKILSANEIKSNASSFHAPSLLFPNPKNLYQRRAQRLRDLADSSSFPDYCLFLAQLVEQQLQLLEQNPIPIDPRITALTPEELAIQPLQIQRWQRDPIWQTLLHKLLDSADIDDIYSMGIEELKEKSADELEQLADKLLNLDFHGIAPDQALFLWAALSLYWLQLAQQIPHNSVVESAEGLHICPVCGSAPVASVIHMGAEQGLRYLHCSLCETEWNFVRSKCTNCDETGKLDYWSIDNKLAAAKTESCSHCHSYLKVLYQDRDPKVEAVVDSFVNLLLDIEMDKKGFAASGVNPFMLPSL